MSSRSSQSHASTDPLALTPCTYLSSLATLDNVNDHLTKSSNPEKSDDLRITPDDSVSQANRSNHSRCSRRSSSGSSIREKMVEEEAQRKALEAKLKGIHEEQLLAEQRYRLRMEEMELARKEEYLKIKSELAQSTARSNVYSQAMNESERHSTLKKQCWNPKAVEFTPAPERNGSNVTNLPVNDNPELIGYEQPFNESVTVDPPDIEARKIFRNNRVPNRYSYSENDTLHQMLQIQERQMVCMEQMINSQNQSSLSLTLPKAEIFIYDGKPRDYLNFVKTFKSLIESKTTCHSTRLNYLIQYTSGDVQDLMKSCLPMSPERGYHEALSLLKNRYGNEYRIASSLADEVINGSVIKSEDGKALFKLSTDLLTCANTLKEIGYLSKIENPESLRKIVDRLPYDLRKKWRTKANNITELSHREVNIDDISKFVSQEARISNHPVFGNISKLDGSQSSLRLKYKNQLKGDKSHNKKYSFGTQIKEEETDEVYVDNQTKDKLKSNNYKRLIKCPKCEGDHKLTHCKTFLELSVESRRTFVSENRICFNCLYPNHRAKFCRQNIACDKCKGRHSTLLHLTEANSAFVMSKKTVGLPIVPVIVKSKWTDNSVVSYALQDWGSTGTFCTDSLLDRMGIHCETTTLSLTTLDEDNREVTCRKTNLEVFDLSGEKGIELKNVFSRPKLPVSDKDIPRQEDVAKWKHLNGVKISEVNAGVDIIIGMDNNQALEPKKIIASKDGGPYAVETIFGWSINGPLMHCQGSTNWHRSSNFIRADEELNRQFESFCNLEFNDLQDKEFGMSVEDKQALTVFEDTSKLIDGHYEISLPWKQNPPDMPNNLFLAKQRLGYLKKKFIKDEYLFQRYSIFIDGLLQNNYAEEIPAEEINRNDGMVWYLPHHPVVHPKKPDKLRVVFDCAARYQGLSLNDKLMQGPDLINTLFGVLVRFRQEYVALMGDIESMFHQVRVTPNHTDVLRFLWWKSNNLQSEPVEFRMKVHIFGSISSPSVCNFALRKTAEDNKSDFEPKIIETVMKNFYVDDHLKSFESENDAIEHIKDITSLLRRGGFRLTKWNSNAKRVLESVSENDRAASVKDLDLDNLPVERALGILWNMETDTFTFNVDLKEKPATRRGILSIMSSVFDPLGFAAPLILPAKIILQELCRIRLSWDDDIPEKYLNSWLNWLEELPKLSRLTIDRCMKPAHFKKVSDVQLHHFSDASELGYGAVSYVRMIDIRGNIHCSFVAAKSRVSPLKVMTIPRLELSAATLSIRLNRMITQELDFDVNKSIYWTDSTSVLKYIFNVEKRFKTFVANRIAVIREGSKPEDWRFISGKANPGDEASRGMPMTAFLQNKRWLSGPTFLWKPESEWDHQPDYMNSLSPDDPEIKEKKMNFAQMFKEDDAILNLAERYSSWYKFKKITAWLLRYKEKLRMAVKKGRSDTSASLIREENPKLTVNNVKEAEIEIIKHLQRRHFPEEIRALEKNKSISRKSSINRLDPILVNGVLRVGGRLRLSEEPFESRHQIILPKKTHVSQLIIRHYHEMSAHSGRCYILSAIRRRFWIIKGNAAVRGVLSKCVVCKKRQAPTGSQKMSDLPTNRVTPNQPPFSSVGVDCFGPFIVKRGRSQLKRWGCIFTCLACRAIHIEVLHTMDTDCFINCLRRFIARRGCPAKIISDNGSNFVGGNTELRKAIGEWNQQSIHEFLLQKNINWSFNPPGGSHFGGVWERCIRTIRQVLKALMTQQMVDDETLETLFCEVEGIINGRPLTPMSDDKDDLQALTPNHLLLLKSGPELPPGKFKKQDCYSRRRWRHVQYLADIFWRRWTREYLPLLQERQKWNKNQKNFRVGDIVLVSDHELPRHMWPLGRILEVYTNDHDGHVRVVKVKTRTSVLKRPVDKCVYLESTPT